MLDFLSTILSGFCLIISCSTFGKFSHEWVSSHYIIQKHEKIYDSKYGYFGFWVTILFMSIKNYNNNLENPRYPVLVLNVLLVGPRILTTPFSYFWRFIRKYRPPLNTHSCLMYLEAQLLFSILWDCVSKASRSLMLHRLCTFLIFLNDKFILSTYLPSQANIPI